MLRFVVLASLAARLVQAQLIGGFTPGTVRNNFGNYVGVQFTTDGSLHDVTALGRVVLIGNTGTHVVKLVHASDGTDVAGASVTVSTASGTPGKFVYANLAAPVYLQPLTSYYLVSLETFGGDSWYDITPVQGSQFTFNGPVYFNGAAWIRVGIPNQSYVPVNMIFDGTITVPSTVSITSPAPNSSFSDTNITLSANAGVGADYHLTGVQFKLDNVPVGPLVTTGPPYTMVVDSHTLANGLHYLIASAMTALSSMDSAAVTFSVNNANSPPGAPFITGFTPSIIRSNYAGLVGMQFTTGPTPITLNALGRLFLPGNNGTHLLKLLTAADGKDVPGATAQINMSGGAPGQFKYATLASPVMLMANTAYYLASQEAGSDQWYDFMPVTATNAGTVNAPVYFNGAQWVSVPYAGSFGPLNFLYTVFPAAGPEQVAIASTSNLSGYTADAVITGGGTVAGIQFTFDGITFPEFAPQGKCVQASQYYSDSTGYLFLGNGLICHFTPPAIPINYGGHSLNVTVRTSDGNKVMGNGGFYYIAPQHFFAGFANMVNFIPGTLRNNYTGWVGFEFTATSDASPSIGRLCVAGNTAVHVVKIVDAATGADVPGSSAWMYMGACIPGSYVDAVTGPSLLAGHLYYLVSQETAGGDQWFDVSLAMPQTVQTPFDHPAVSTPFFFINGAVYFNGFQYVVIPGANYSYVGLQLANQLFFGS